MKDPHVVSLTYRLKTDATVSFDDPPPIEDDTDSFHVRLDRDELTASLKDHFPSVQNARDVVDPWLHSWEIYTALEHSGQRQIWFDYEDANHRPRSTEAWRADHHSSRVRCTTNLKHRERNHVWMRADMKPKPGSIR